MSITHDGGHGTIHERRYPPPDGFRESEKPGEGRRQLPDEAPDSGREGTQPRHHRCDPAGRRRGDRRIEPRPRDPLAGPKETPDDQSRICRSIEPLTSDDPTQL